uniref:Uncharacterized protein n=1 Tax=Rhizophora mucronata TaxID=61149 RepID=A0A2P2PNX1_RHIMU
MNLHIMLRWFFFICICICVYNDGKSVNDLHKIMQISTTISTCHIMCSAC